MLKFLTISARGLLLQDPRLMDGSTLAPDWDLNTTSVLSSRAILRLVGTSDTLSW